MVIKQLNLESFGKFKDKKIELNNGINLIYGKNERGKSTIKNFVELIFAGLLDGAKSEQFDNQVKKYEPWQQDEYLGSIIFDDQQAYTVEKNFKNNGDIKVYAHHDDSESIVSQKIEHLKEVGLIGISEMKGVKGRELIAQLIQNISNVKQSNIAGLDFERVVNSMNSDINELKLSEEYIFAKEQLNRVEDEISQITATSEELKRSFRNLNDLDSQIKTITDRIKQLEQQREEETVVEHSTKVEALETINNKIGKLERELEELNKFTEIGNEDIQEFLMLQQAHDNNLERLEGLKNDVRSIQDGIKMSSSSVDKNVLVLLQDKNTKERLITYIDTYKNTKNDMEDTRLQMEKYQDMLDVNIRETESGGVDHNLTERELEELEKDYYKFVNTSGWRMHISSDEPLIASNEEHESEIKVKKNNSRKMMPLIGFSVLLLIASIAYVIGFGFEYYKVAITAVSLGLLIFAVIRRNFILKPVGALQAKIDLNNSKIAKNSELKLKYDKELEYIMNKHNCDSYDAFHEYYKGIIPIKDNTVSRIHEKISYLEDEKVKLQVKERITIKNIKQLLADRSDGEDEDVEHKIEQLEEYIKIISVDLTSKNNRISNIKRQIEKLEYDIKMSNIELSKNPVSKIGKDEGIKVIEEKQLRIQDISGEIEQLYQSKSELLEGMSEDEFFSSVKKGNTNGNEGEKVLLDMPINDVINEQRDMYIELQKDVTKQEQVIIELSEQIARLKQLKARGNQYKHVMDEIEEEIRDIETVKNKMAAASGAVSGDYTHQITGKMNTILYEVTGKYNDMKIDHNMSVYFKEENTKTWIPVERLSLGTIDQVFFALRVGLADSIYKNVNLPIILDDSFIQYDKKRLENILNVIAGMQRQVIILSCHLREKDIFDQNQIQYNYVELSS